VNPEASEMVALRVQLVEEVRREKPEVEAVHLAHTNLVVVNVFPVFLEPVGQVAPLVHQEEGVEEAAEVPPEVLAQEVLEGEAEVWVHSKFQMKYFQYLLFGFVRLSLTLPVL
jgi:hypothetical protein